jgi:hypothetical protein
MILLGEDLPEGDLMAAVRWSRMAEVKLENINQATRDQLESGAAEILHDITSNDLPHDEGRKGNVMWHRGIRCGMLSEELLAKEDEDGPWNYFLFYSAVPPEAQEPDQHQTFEVLDVCSVAEIARRWKAWG